MDTTAVRAYLVDLQARIVARLEELDGARFIADPWARAEGGGGVTRILEAGGGFERARVGFSHVAGTPRPPSASAHRPQNARRAWGADGGSRLLPPRHPHPPPPHLKLQYRRAC